MSPNEASRPGIDPQTVVSSKPRAYLEADPLGIHDILGPTDTRSATTQDDLAQLLRTWPTASRKCDRERV
jgi:hypothetical protein